MTDSSTGRNLISAAIFAAGLLLAGYVYYSGDTVPSPAPAAQVNQVSRSKPAVKPIEQIRVGDRVAAHNPEVSNVERASWEEPDWRTWVKLSLRITKQNGSHADVEVLRPRAWLRENLIFAATRRPCMLKLPVAAPTTSRSLIPLHPVYCELIATASSIEAGGGEVAGLCAYLDLPELGIQGLGLVTDIQLLPLVKPGTGRVVTATFAHSSADVIDLVIEDSTGQQESIGVTSNHPFWSIDRQQFIPAGDLQNGESLQAYSGRTQHIVSKTPRKDATVYNLEVHGEHVYYVGKGNVLVHNNGCGEAAKGVDTGVMHDAHINAPRVDVNDLDNLALEYAAQRSTGRVFEWIDFERSLGIEISPSFAKRIRHRADALGLLERAPTNSRNIADFRSWQADIYDANGNVIGTQMYVPELMFKPYKSHFGYLDSRFVKPDTHVWDHMARNGWIQAIRRDVHALTDHKGFFHWTRKVE